MYPKEIFLGLDLYTILMLVGVLACMIFIRVLSDRRGMRAAWQNLVLFNALAAVVLGYGAAVLLQGFYNYMDDGVFEIGSRTGATFYGGLIGGTATFIIIYFVVGHFLYPNGYHAKHFRDVSDLAAPCITVAHGFGRLGCFMAGCCYGKPTDAWYGVQMAHLDHKVIPVQLFEAIFLLAFSALLFLAFWERRKYLLPTYMLVYGVWRFFAEQMRADDRGATVVDFLTPSQLISVLLIAGGLVLLAIEIGVDRRAKAQAETPTDGTVALSEEDLPEADTETDTDTDTNTNGDTDTEADGPATEDHG